MDNFKILTIGDTCKDVYVYGNCPRLCPDAPIPIFIPLKTGSTDGMLGNVINNIRVFGIEPDILTNTKEITKTRYVDNKTNQMIIRIDQGEEYVERVRDLDKIDYISYDAILISDYCKGFLEEDDIEYICNNHSTVFIDTKKIINRFCENALFIKINDSEYNVSKSNIKKMNLFDSLITTMGSKGAQYKDVLYPVERVDIKDQTGAGDTFIASLVIKYLQTRDIGIAITFANKCSTYVVQKRGVVITLPYEN